MKQPSIAAVPPCCSGSMRRLLARGPPTGPTVVVNSGRSRCTIIGTSSRFGDRAFAAARPPLWNSLPTAWLHDSFCRKPRAFFVRGTSARLGPVVAVVLGGVYTFLLTYFLTQWPNTYTGSCYTRTRGRSQHAHHHHYFCGLPQVRRGNVFIPVCLFLCLSAEQIKQ